MIDKKIGYIVEEPVWYSSDVKTYRFVPTDETLARGIGGFSNCKSKEELEEILAYKEEHEQERIHSNSQSSKGV